MNSYQFTNSWFQNSKPTWDLLIPNLNPTTILEVGSYEGASTCYLIDNLSNSKNLEIHCVDTWEGADEHKDGTWSTEGVLSNIENTFDDNLQRFKGRISKYKGSSQSFFNSKAFVRTSYDFIYVDGSHHSHDVMIDAIKCFEMLKVGGIMIFDDYFWSYYAKAIDNPASAVNLFLHMKKGSYKIVRFYYQMVIIKTAE